MNKQIIKLFAFIMVLFGVLIGFTSYWSVFDAKALKEKNANKRPLLEAQQIRRGRILTADGTVINRDFARAWLPHAVEGGSRADVPIEIPAPDEPGRYALKFDLVSEGIDWFEACGSPTTMKTLLVL